jgi:hypothetical protein
VLAALEGRELRWLALLGRLAASSFCLRKAASISPSTELLSPMDEDAERGGGFGDAASLAAVAVGGGEGDAR